MLDNISILNQLHELILVNKLRDLSINILESFQVGAIIVKLPPSWNNFRKKLLHTSEDLTLEKFGQHLRIEEESQVRDGTNTNFKVNVNNVSNVQSGSSSKANKYLKVNKSGSDFMKNNSNNPNICECKLLKSKKKDEEGNAIETNVIEDIVAMVSGMHIDMITEVHIAVIANPFDWWFDLGATVHVCNNKEQFRTYDESFINNKC